MKRPGSPARRVPRARSAPPFALLAVALLAPVASAHASLQTADPPPNGHADSGVTIVTFVFSEDVEREYTSADVVDLQGESMASGPVEFDAEEPNVIHIPVRPLPSGIYAANWRALSVDTHTTRGSFVFAVGNASLRPGQYPAEPSDPAEHDTARVLRDGFARFAFYAGLLLVVGVPLFALLVLRAPVPRGPYATAAAFGLVGGVGGFVALLFLGERTGLGVAGALGTLPGRSLLLRATLTLAAALACWGAAASPDRREAPMTAIALGVLAMLATAAGSHAAAVQERTGALVLADALHLLMGAVWIGGVVAFAHVAWDRSAADLAAIVARFSPLALASVALLLATGAIASLAHMPCASAGGVPCLRELRTEPYVQLVAFKLLLMLPLIGIGAYHKLRAGPRLARGEHAPRAFRRLLAIEAVVMALVLGAAGILAASAPPERAVDLGTPHAPSFELESLTKTSHVILQVAPNPVTVGIQRVTVVVHPLGPTLPNATQVQLKVWPEGEPEPDVTTEIPKVAPNEWEIETGLFTRAGTWHVRVLLQRPDEFAKIPFQVPVVNPP